MASSPPANFPSEPENGLQERLIRSIWLHKDKYCYLFEPDGSYQLLSTDRRGQYTISADGRSVLLAWTTDPFTEELRVLENGSLFMSGSEFVEIGMRSLAPSVPPSPDVETAERSFYKSLQEAKTAGQQKIDEKLKQGYIRADPSKAPLPPIPEERVEPDSTPYWLPEDFRVFTNHQGTVGTDSGGGQGIEQRILPTVNQYTGPDGGYVAFYSRDPAKAVYSVGGGIYVVGQIRLKGRYIGRIFHPEGYEHQDISAMSEFKALCRKTFGVEGWAGGDTGGWFGVNSCPEAIGDRPNSKIDTASLVRPAWKQGVSEGAGSLLSLIRIEVLLPVMVLLSPTLFILWGAFARVGLSWNLLLIPVGAIVGGVLMASAGAALGEFIFWLDDRQTGSPEAGSIGAATGRAIMTFILMVLLGWIGSGLGAWWVASYWVNS